MYSACITLIIIGFLLFLALWVGWFKYRRVPLYKITLVLPPNNDVVTGSGYTLGEIVESLALQSGRPDRKVRENIREQYHAVRQSLEQQRAWPILAEIMHVSLDTYISTAIDRCLWHAVADLVPKSSLDIRELEALLKICAHPASKQIIQRKLDSIQPSISQPDPSV
jgi:predicted naringenin-chalcone synthase